MKSRLALLLLPPLLLRLSPTDGHPTLTSFTTTSPLPPGNIGQAYITYINTNGTEPYGYYSWSATSGAYPPGLSLYTTLSANPQFSGTPSAAGTYTFALHVNDGLTGQALDTSFTITIIAAPPFISTSSLPTAIAGAAYAATLAATGGNGGNAWSVLSGSWPPGLALASSGAISGTPSTQGTYNFTVK